MAPDGMGDQDPVLRGSIVQAFAQSAARIFLVSVPIMGFCFVICECATVGCYDWIVVDGEIWQPCSCATTPSTAGLSWVERQLHWCQLRQTSRARVQKRTSLDHKRRPWMVDAQCGCVLPVRPRKPEEGVLCLAAPPLRLR
jgi:hypothetical protein